MQVITHITKSLTWTPYDTRWCPSSAKFVAVGMHARGSGILQVYELDQGKLSVVSESDKRIALKCCTFGAADLETRHLATGDFEGRLSTWDLEIPTVPVFTAKEHNQIINSIDGVGGLGIGGGAPEIVTGSRDGSVLIWDTRVTKPVARFGSSSSDSGRDCWAVCFGNSYNDTTRWVAAGYDNGDMKLFDLCGGKFLWNDNIGNGVCTMSFDRKDIQANKLLVGGLESTFVCYDMRTLHPEKGYSRLDTKIHNATVWVTRPLPQNRDICASTGGNGSICIQKYEYPAQRSKKDSEDKDEGVPGTLHKLKEHSISTQPIVGCDWCADKTGLCCFGSLDQTVRVGFVTDLDIQ